MTKEMYVDMHTDGVRLKVGPARRISRLGERNWFPRLLELPDGSILQFNATVDDDMDAIRRTNGSNLRITRDGGETWTDFPKPGHYGFPVVLGDGHLRSFSYAQWKRSDGTVYGMVSDLTLDQSNWSDERESQIHLPPTTADQNGVCSLTMDRSILCEPDGSFLATQYGRLAGAKKYCCVVVRSADEGMTWEYLSTIAYDPEIPGEGYCEPVMARVADGSLLAVMRTGGRDYPMYQCRSTDNGRTWSQPENLGVYSVDPDLCLMRSGILACSFGRPTVNIMFSLDGSGKNWSTPTTLFTGNSTCYTGLREIADRRLLLVYDSNTNGSPWQARDNQINAVVIEVL